MEMYLADNSCNVATVSVKGIIRCLEIGLLQYPVGKHRVGYMLLLLVLD